MDKILFRKAKFWTAMFCSEKLDFVQKSYVLDREGRFCSEKLFFLTEKLDFVR